MEKVMETQVYYRDDFAKMDSMEDLSPKQISVSDKSLIIVYEYADESWEDEGIVTYTNKITIEYEFLDHSFFSVCYAKLFKKRRYKFIDILTEKNKFYKLTDNFLFTSHGYAIDNSGKLTLRFFILNTKYWFKHWVIEIYIDAKKITYQREKISKIMQYYNPDGS